MGLCRKAREMTADRCGGDSINQYRVGTDDAISKAPGYLLCNC